MQLSCGLLSSILVEAGFGPWLVGGVYGNCKDTSCIGTSVLGGTAFDLFPHFVHAIKFINIHLY